MNLKYIIAENAKSNEIEEILMNLANNYADTGFTDEIKLFQNLKQANSFLISFNNTPDFDRFAYFVNYIKYPEGFENHKIDVIGYAIADSIPKQININKGGWLMFYIPKNDTEYDNVYIVTEDNYSYKFDFGGKVTKMNKNERQFEKTSFNKSDYEFVMNIIPTKKAIGLEVKPWWKFWK